VAAAPINKLDLLNLFKQAYGLDVDVVPDGSLVIDRSLDGRRFEEETGIRVGSWAEMVDDLAADQTPYERLRNVIGTC
jgi:dTDP-4-dehydrorhamnose reductase